MAASPGPSSAPSPENLAGEVIPRRREYITELFKGKEPNANEHVQSSPDKTMAKECDDIYLANLHDVSDLQDFGGSNLEPHEGMEFESYEEVSSFYRSYAKREGFIGSIKSSRRSKKNNEFIDIKFVCSRHGKKVEHSKVKYPRPSARVGCKAAMYVKKREDDGRWFAYYFVKEHNHELLKEELHLLRSRRRGTTNKNSVHAPQSVGAQRRKTSADISKHFDRNQDSGYLEKDREDDLDKEWHLNVGADDSQAMLDHFMHMQAKNPNFFYALDLNEEQCLRNVFWVDAKGRHDYISFGDVVSFDTNYVTNKYKMPFAPFLGVNHHGQLVVLGCALIVDESISTFVWLMKRWLRAMGGLAPKTIITYQSNAIKAAISQVFPNSQHCYCLWHITRQILEKLSHITHRHKDFMGKFNKCVYRSWTEEEFERRWSKMTTKFELSEDEWLWSLHEDRRQWVPTYTRDTFLAGMSTAERGESTNSSFDKYISRKTTLKEFVERYEVSLHDMYKKESTADFQSWHTKPELKSPSPYELQMSSIYTRDIFTKFQVEVMGTRACYATKVREDWEIATFMVNDLEKEQEFIVAWNQRELDISCLCCSFQFKGFLCRHALSVLQFSGVSKIPPRYILKRWTKDAKTSIITNQTPIASASRMQRYNDICRRAVRLAQEGSRSEDSYNFALCVLERMRKCVDLNDFQENPNTRYVCAVGVHHDYSDSLNAIAPTLHLKSTCSGV